LTRAADTGPTVVESNVHYPTDSSLLGDGIGVLSRSLQRIASECKNGAIEVADHELAIAKLFMIHGSQRIMKWLLHFA
jgi:Na+-transporting NADH:ubiquinone oxidoreductase subunit NqrA